MVFVPLKSAYIPPHHRLAQVVEGESCPPTSKIFKRKILVEVRYNPTHPVKQQLRAIHSRDSKALGYSETVYLYLPTLLFDHLHSLFFTRSFTFTFFRQSQLDLKHCASLLKYIINIKPLSVKIVNGMPF